MADLSFKGIRPTTAHNMRVLYSIVSECARLSQPCPSNAELATRLNVAPSQPPELLRKLQKLGLVEVSASRASRTVRVVESGRRTQPSQPGGGGRAWTPDEKNYVQEHMTRKAPAEIAAKIKRTEKAVQGLISEIKRRQREDKYDSPTPTLTRAVKAEIGKHHTRTTGIPTIGSLGAHRHSVETARAHKPRIFGPVRECRWPMWDEKPPRGSAFIFCEAPAAPDRPYCPAHCARAYRRRVKDEATGQTVEEIISEKEFAA